MTIYVASPVTSGVIRDAKSTLTAQTRVYMKMSNPSWNIDRKLVNKLIKMALALPHYDGLFPFFDEGNPSGSILSDSKGPKLWANEDYVVLYTGKIIEVRHDSDRIIENEILRSAPEEIYKEICHYI